MLRIITCLFRLEWVIAFSLTQQKWILVFMKYIKNDFELLTVIQRLESYSGKFFIRLTGLAQSKVVRRTPIRGITVIMRSVNLAKYSWANTA